MRNYRDEVYSLLTRIPRGKVMTYGQVAKKLRIKSPRQVGRILGENKHPEKFPCHRVVGADGSVKGYAYGGIKRKTEMLHKEGVVFNGNKVDLTVSRAS